MSNATLSMLDQAELLQLSLEADRNGDSAASLAYLKEAGSRPDASAETLLMLGASYASLQMYDRAAVAMEAAVAANPQLAIARFQLGLLYLSSGDGPRANDMLVPLDDLGESMALYHFGRGLRHLLADEFADALRYLQRGIEMNQNNPALNVDMQRLVDEINKLPEEQRQQSAGAGADGNQHVMLSAYTGRGTH
jgi:tetratricopeptide (TPR) repeat protein